MAKTYLIVSNRGTRGNGNEGVVCERGVAEADLAERERFWHDSNAPCETYCLSDSDEKTTIDAAEHQAVVPVDTAALEAEAAAAAAAEEEAEAARIARVTA